MNSFWIALLLALTVVMSMPLTALAETGINLEDKLAKEPPVGDFDPPRSSQVRIIEDGPVLQDYRSIPQPPIGQGHWNQSEYADLWKSTCESSPDLQFFLSKFSFSDESKKLVTKYLVGLVDKSSRLRCAPVGTDVYIEENSPLLSGMPYFGAVKPALNKSECTALYQMALQQQDKLKDCYEQFISNDRESSASARLTLIEMAGSQAVERLDRAIAKRSHP